MNLEQVTFRVDIEGPHVGQFVHFVQTGNECFSVKIGDLIMSVNEFQSYVTQLQEIERNLPRIGEFARDINA